MSRMEGEDLKTPCQTPHPEEVALYNGISPPFPPHTHRGTAAVEGPPISSSAIPPGRPAGAGIMSAVCKLL
jgi:hypothetical protein